MFIIYIYNDLFIFFFHLFILVLFQYNFPKISIIVPIYNTNQYLNECLISLQNQTLKDIEIICINDGSTDNSLDIIMKFINDNRFIIINKGNSGYGDSMNQGLNFANGEYIGIVESDDFVDIEMFKSLYKYTTIGKIDLIRSNYFFYWEENKKEFFYFDYLKNSYNKLFNITDFPEILFISPSIWAGIYNKNFLIKNNIKFLSTPGASYQETSFSFKTLYKSKNILFTNDSFYYYRQTNLNSSMNNKSLTKSIFINKEFYEIDKFFKKDLNLFYQIEKVYNTKKIKTLFWNLKRNENKGEYFKYFYKDVFEILKNQKFLYSKFKNYELRLFNYLINYSEKIGADIFLNSLQYNEINPAISIIIPIFNSENYIKECLNSLIYQTFKNFEIICVNDGSTDNTLEILKEFKNKDKRIHIINQNNIGAEIARNIGMKESKGEYLMFLDSNDIFSDTMLEELYAKIKENNLEIIICNSINFKILNDKKIFNEHKNYIFSKDQIFFFEQTFSSQNIDKFFFEIFIWWPWDKIFKKDFIENLEIDFKNLNSTNYLIFIYLTVLSSKKISFLDKIFINHRIGVKLSKENFKENKYDNFYYAIKELKNFIKKKNLYKKFKRDFINYVASFSIWTLESIYGNSFCYLYQKLRNEWWNEFDVIKYNKKYFYNINVYKKINYILKTQLKQNDTSNKIKINDKKINYLKDQKNTCFYKNIIPYYIIDYNYKLKILYFMFLTLKL